MLTLAGRLRALAHVAAVWVLLAIVWPLDAIHPDSTHDLLMVRDCLELARCDTAGPMSSWHDLHQGALWINLLALARAVWTPWGTALFLTLLNAIALVATLRWRQVRAPLDTLTQPLLLITALLATSVVLLMPTAMWPLSLVATCLFLHLLETPHSAGFAVLCVLAGLTVDVHAMAWPLVWTMSGIHWWRGRRLHALALLFLPLATSLAISPRTWELLARDFAHDPSRFRVLLGLPVAWALLRWVRHTSPQRQLAFVGLLVWLAIGVTHQFALRYLLPWSGALILALPAQVPPARVTVVFARLLVVLLCVWRIPLTVAPLTYRAVSDVAIAAQTSHLGWPDVLTGLRGPHASLLAESSALYLPLQRLGPPRPVQVPAARVTVSRLHLSAAQVCVGQSTCQPLNLAPGPRETSAPFVARAIPFQLPTTRPFIPLVVQIPVAAGLPTRVTVAPTDRGTHYLLRPPRTLRDTLQPSPVQEPCDWRFANGLSSVALDGTAQTLTLTCPSLRHAGDATPRLLPGLLESCAESRDCGVPTAFPLPSLPPQRVSPPLPLTRAPWQAWLVASLALGVYFAALVFMARRPRLTTL